MKSYKIYNATICIKQEMLFRTIYYTNYLLRFVLSLSRKSSRPDGGVTPCSGHQFVSHTVEGSYSQLKRVTSVGHCSLPRVGRFALSEIRKNRSNEMLKSHLNNNSPRWKSKTWVNLKCLQVYVMK